MLVGSIPDKGTNAVDKSQYDQEVDNGLNGRNCWIKLIQVSNEKVALHRGAMCGLSVSMLSMMSSRFLAVSNGLMSSLPIVIEIKRR